MQSAKTALEKSQSWNTQKVQQEPPTLPVQSNRSILRRAKSRLYTWEQMLLGELLAWTLPATDFRRR